MPPKLTNEIIDAAIEGFEAQKRRLDEQIAELRAMLPGGKATTSTPGTARRRQMSAATRKAMAEGQRKRWAAAKGATPTAEEKQAKKPKGKLSAAGRAAIAEAQRKRWAAKKAAK